MNSVVAMLLAIKANPLIAEHTKSEAGWLARLIQSPRLGPALQRDLGGEWRDWLLD